MRCRFPIATSLVCLGLASALVSVASGGIRSTGKYCGTVIFDRWDGCILYSGIYVMYVSEAVKAPLREHRSKSVEIDAKKVSQPINPGDGLIKELVYLRPAPTARDWIPLEGLGLRVDPALTVDEKARLTITVSNNGTRDVEVRRDELAPTLLMKIRPGQRTPFDPSDGPSTAKITRCSFDAVREDGSSSRGWSIDGHLPGAFVLKPKQKRLITIKFNDLADGEYDFLAGYGGGVHEGKGVASNLIAFDVGEKGKAKIVNVKGR
jgi:hypothetical protein